MNFKQQTFITEYLRHNSAYTAYCLAYNPKEAGNYDSIMSAANRLLNDPKVGGVIDSILSGVRHDVEQEIRAKLRTDLLTTQRKREILAKIATGEMYAVQVYKGKDCNQCTQHVMPTIHQMLKAIDLDNKMVGLYSSTVAHHKPQTAPALNTDSLQQVDAFLKSVGLLPEQIENSSVEEPAPNPNSSFEGGAAGGGCTPAPGKNAEIPTNDNKTIVEDVNAVDTPPPAGKKLGDWQQKTTMLGHGLRKMA